MLSFANTYGTQDESFDEFFCLKFAPSPFHRYLFAGGARKDRHKYDIRDDDNKVID